MYRSANQVSNDNTSFSAGSILFTYNRRVTVVNFNPSKGPSDGGTEVFVTGKHFSNTTQLLCRFGVTVVPAISISDQLILCTSPPHPHGASSLEVTTNGADFSFSGAQFIFYPREKVLSVWPALGPSSEGGTLVTIRGEAFQNSVDLSCQFGRVIGIRTTWLSPTEVLCESPPHPPGLVAVKVTNNGVDFSSSAAEYFFAPDASVMDVQPIEVFEQGQVPFFLRGSNFMNTTTLACRIGSVVVKALFLESDLMACIVPSHSAQLRLQRKLGNFSVEATVNGVDFTDSGKTMKFSQSIPVGHYMRNWMSTVVPNGTYSTAQSQLNFTMCAPGSFQPSAGAWSCLACPSGYICPGALGYFCLSRIVAVITSKSLHCFLFSSHEFCCQEHHVIVN